MKFKYPHLILSLLIIVIIILFGVGINKGYEPSDSVDQKSEKALSALRSMHTALSAYFIDYDTYPTNLYKLTTPIAYLIRVPEEPYGGMWIFSYSEDSTFLIVQSSIHPEIKRGFVNETKLRSFSEEKLIQLILNGEQPDIRKSATLILHSKTHVDRKKLLAEYFVKESLNNSDTTIRINAIEAIGTVLYHYSSQQVFTDLNKNLYDPNPAIRIATILALNPFRVLDIFPEKQNLSDKPESELMRILATDTTSTVRAESAKALGEYSPGDIHQQILPLSLLTALNDSAITVRANAAFSLSRQAQYVADSTAVIISLIKMVKQDKPPAQIAAMASLGEFKAKPATPLLLSYLSSENPEIKTTAINVLCEIGDANAVPEMQKILGPEFNLIREPLIAGLAASNEPKATEIILSWINDPDPKIREAVVISLRTIKSSKMKPLLLTALQDTESEIRVVAAGSLNRIEPNLSNRTYLKQLSIPDKIKLSTGEFAMMRAGLEAYYIDNGRYPLVQHFPFVLTTPVAYISYIPVEPFYKTTITFYRYYTPPSGQEWMVASDGPDQITDIDLSQVHYNPFQSDSLKPFNYNPTNGLMSNGDIWHQGP